MLFFNKKKKYVSCDLIEHGLDFFADSINFCCRIPPNYTEFKKLIPDYHGEILDWNEFFKIKKQYREMMRKGKMIPECKDCYYLQEKEWDSEDYISFINFNNWNICNVHCVYCNLHNEKQPKQYNVYPVVKDLADKGYIKKGGHITIAGGEPCVAPEFDDLLKLFIDLDLNPIRVLTNATKYSPVVERGIAEGKVNIVVSVDSGTQETFIKVKNDDFYERVWDNLSKYAKVQPRPDLVKTKYILIPDLNDKIEEIDAWLNKSIEVGIKHVAFDIEHNWFIKNHNSFPSETFSVVSYVLNKVEELGLDIELIDRGAVLANMIKSAK